MNFGAEETKNSWARSAAFIDGPISRRSAVARLAASQTVALSRLEVPRLPNISAPRSVLIAGHHGASPCWQELLCPASAALPRSSALTARSSSHPPALPACSRCGWTSRCVWVRGSGGRQPASLGSRSEGR